MSFSIATWNVNSLNVRLPHVCDWLEQYPVDILALQETKMTNDKFPEQALKDLGYQVSFNGQKTYNGVAILSKQALTDIDFAFPDYDDPSKRVLAATINNTRVLNLYVPNGASLDSDKYQYKLTWLEHLIAYTKAQLAQYEHVILLGDFNIAPADSDVHDPSVWQDCVLVSQAERDAFQALLDLGLQDSFHLQAEREPEFSWWDYRRAAFRRNLGLRIDHILVSDALAKHCEFCKIDKEPRGWERPSDHAPVYANFVFND